MKLDVLYVKNLSQQNKDHRTPVPTKERAWWHRTSSQEHTESAGATSSVDLLVLGEQSPQVWGWQSSTLSPGENISP